MRRFIVAALAALGVVGLSSNFASAGLTTVNPTPAMYGSEDNTAEILSHVLGGTFVADGANFTNGSITVRRVDDNDDQIMHTGTNYSAKAVAAFSAAAQSFGYFLGSSGGTYTNLFDVTGYGYAVNGEVNNLNMSGVLRLGRGGGGSIWSSLESDNSDGADHMVTYEIMDNDLAKKKHIIFFEDGNMHHNGDFDYNDLAVLITSDRTQCHAIPLPAAAVPGLVTLVGGGLIARSRKARRLLK